MTIEQLLVPRWKVIADYPNSRYKLGEIYKAFKAKINIAEEEYQLFISTDEPHADWDRPEEYPAIFRKLEWWEERNKEHLPKYAKKNNKVYRIVYHPIFSVYSYLDGTDNMHHLRDLLPATEEEYLNQKK